MCEFVFCFFFYHKKKKIVIKVPRLVRTRQQVTVLDIANRIMRRDNYLIALANSATPANQSQLLLLFARAILMYQLIHIDLLRLPRWCWNVLGGKQLLATQVCLKIVHFEAFSLFIDNPHSGVRKSCTNCNYAAIVGIRRSC